MGLIGGKNAKHAFIRRGIVLHRSFILQRPRQKPPTSRSPTTSRLTVSVCSKTLPLPFVVNMDDFSYFTRPKLIKSNITVSLWSQFFLLNWFAAAAVANWKHILREAEWPRGGNQLKSSLETPRGKIYLLNPTTEEDNPLFNWLTSRWPGVVPGLPCRGQCSPVIKPHFVPLNNAVHLVGKANGTERARVIFKMAWNAEPYIWNELGFQD